MEDAVVKQGVLVRKKTGLLRKREARYLALLNSGHLLCSHSDTPCGLHTLKPLLQLTAASSVDRTKIGESFRGIRIALPGEKTTDLEAASEVEADEWAAALSDVIELSQHLQMADGVNRHLQPLHGVTSSGNGWYLEATGKAALYMLDEQQGAWTILEKRIYDVDSLAQYLPAGASQLPTEAQAGDASRPPVAAAAAAAATKAAVVAAAPAASGRGSSSNPGSRNVSPARGGDPPPLPPLDSNRASVFLIDEDEATTEFLEVNRARVVSGKHAHLSGVAMLRQVST